ncbi:acyltransferase domain-containing protein [Actinomadura welshii]
MTHYRPSVNTGDPNNTLAGLRAIAEGKHRPHVFSVDSPVTNGPVWVLAGFGAQHRKMGKNLYLRNQIFAEWIEKVDVLVQDELGYSLLELILDDAQDYGIETTQHVRPSAMVQFDGLHSVRLEAGVLSIGWVVTVLGVALERADHVVLACSVVFRVSRQRAQRRLPETSVASPARVASSARLLLLAVPDC